MFTTSKPVFLLVVTLLGTLVQKDASTVSISAPEYTANAELKLPEDYREWVFLSSDFHANPDPSKMQRAGHNMFNNIFVSPGAYKAFLQTGTWPDKTMFVFEGRGAESVSMNNQTGDVQGSVEGLAVHLKDEGRFPGKWAFFGFHGDKTAKMIPVSAGCYSCHAAHGAVDTTFVQFYPTLTPIAKRKDTFSAAYRREMEDAAPTTK